MKGWMIAALVFTFLSGTSTGILIGRSVTPPEKPTWKDKYVEQVQKAGVTGQEDLERVRQLLEEYEVKVQALKSQLPEELRERIRTIGSGIQKQIVAIIDSYIGPEGGPK